MSVFESAMNIKMDDMESFKSRFNELNEPENLFNAGWCRFEDGSKWRSGPEELILGLKFVLVDRDFIYLGFDTAGLKLWPGFTDEFGIDLDELNFDEEPEGADKYLNVGPLVENLMYTLECLDGVSKVWVKFRMNESSLYEIYSYFPGMGEEYSIVYYLKCSEDDNWPNITFELIMENKYAHIFL